MKLKNFVLTYPLSKTALWAGQIKIHGNYGMQDGQLIVEVTSLFHSKEVVPCDVDWRWIPNTFWTWLENGSDRIGEIAYEHCKGLMPEPAHITDLKTQEKLS